MTLLKDGSILLPLDLLSYLRQHDTARTVIPTISVQLLKFFARRLPTNLLSETAERCINWSADKYAGNDNLKNAFNYAKWREARIKKLTKGMDQAASLVDYESCTTELDQLQGHDEWKAQVLSIESEYDPDIIRAHLEQLQIAAASGDLAEILDLLRTTLSRDLGGMNMLRLYKHSWFGTKKLVDDYINVAVATVDRVLQMATEVNLTTEEASRCQCGLEDALKYFGRSALTLSGGAVLGMKHIGVIKALWEAELLPEIISGASAGSIIAGVVGTKTDEEMMDVLERFPYSDLAVFDPYGTTSLGWLGQRCKTLWKSRALFEMSNMKRVMRYWVGDITFREAHYKTGRVLNICVSSAEKSEPRILNYMTAPDVYIWSAVCASCSVPYVFQPATILEKDPISKKERVWMQNQQQLFVDGSLDHDIPMQKLSEMFNVNFFIVSQVNPHVRIFLEQEESFTGAQPTSNAPRRRRTGKFIGLARDEITHRARLMQTIGIPEAMYRGTSVLNQQYIGHLNILPDISAVEYLSMLSNPTPSFMRQATVIGEKATWPKISRIKNSVAIELSLIRAIHELRDRVNFSPEARAARHAARGSTRGRSRSARGGRPKSLRRRSLSTDYPAAAFTFIGTEGPPSPLPMRDIRRNASAGSLVERLSRLTSNDRPKILAPQAGYDDELSNPSEESLLLTLPGPLAQLTVESAHSDASSDSNDGAIDLGLPLEGRM